MQELRSAPQVCGVPSRLAVVAPQTLPSEGLRVLVPPEPAAGAVLQ